MLAVPWILVYTVGTCRAPCHTSLLLGVGLTIRPCSAYILTLIGKWDVLKKRTFQVIKRCLLTAKTTEKIKAFLLKFILSYLKVLFKKVLPPSWLSLWVHFPLWSYSKIIFCGCAPGDIFRGRFVMNSTHLSSTKGPTERRGIPSHYSQASRVTWCLSHCSPPVHSSAWPCHLTPVPSSLHSPRHPTTASVLLTSS